MRSSRVLDLWKDLTERRNQGTTSLSGPSDAVSASVCNSISNSNQSPNDIPVNVFSLVSSRAPSASESHVSDGDKAGATLLFSGVFLGLLGMAFTVMGWANYDVRSRYDWTQLLGPILLSVGGMFVLISVCKFRMLSCLSCKQIDDDRPPDTDPLPPLAGPSFVFTRLSQPITFHRATVVQYIPPPYASVVPDQSLGPGNGSHSSHQPLAITVSAPPKYCTVNPMENLRFFPSEYNNSTEDQRENRTPGVPEQERNESAADSASSPPAYEQLFHTSKSDSYS